MKKTKPGKTSAASCGGLDSDTTSACDTGGKANTTETVDAAPPTQYRPKRIILPASTLPTTPIVEIEQEPAPAAPGAVQQPIERLVQSSVAKPEPSPELAEILKRSAELE